MNYFIYSQIVGNKPSFLDYVLNSQRPYISDLILPVLRCDFLRFVFFPKRNFRSFFYFFSLVFLTRFYSVQPDLSGSISATKDRNCFYNHQRSHSSLDDRTPDEVLRPASSIHQGGLMLFNKIQKTEK